MSHGEAEPVSSAASAAISVDVALLEPVPLEHAYLLIVRLTDDIIQDIRSKRKVEERHLHQSAAHTQTDTAQCSTMQETAAAFLPSPSHLSRRSHLFVSSLLWCCCLQAIQLVRCCAGEGAEHRRHGRQCECGAWRADGPLPVPGGGQRCAAVHVHSAPLLLPRLHQHGRAVQRLALRQPHTALSSCCAALTVRSVPFASISQERRRVWLIVCVSVQAPAGCSAVSRAGPSGGSCCE